MNISPVKKFDAYPVYLILEGASALFSTMVFTVNMVYQVTVVNLNPLQLVLVGTTLETTAFLCEVPTGVVADVYSRRLSVIIGIFLIGAGFVLQGAIPLFSVILLSQVVSGVGYTFTSGATQAWIADEVGEANAGRAFLRGAQVSQLGALVGIVASVSLASIQVHLPIVLGGGLMVALGVFLLLAMPERGFEPTPSEGRTSWQAMVHTLRNGIQLVRLRPALLTILSIGVIHGMFSEGFDRLWTPHVLENFTLPSLGKFQPVVWFGIINAVSMLLTLVVTELARQRLDTDSHLSVARALFVINAVLIAGIVTFGVAGHF
jgi:DHA3 family tetracycline resistance protein-like MFS transporter